MKLAVDNQVSRQTVWLLEKSGHTVVTKAGDREDREWVSEALEKGAEVFISPDYDIPNLLDKWNSSARWIQLKQGLRGSADQTTFIRKKLQKLSK